MTDHPAAIAERERIVAWLLQDAARTRADLTRMHRGKMLTAAQTEQWECLISLKAGLADAISRVDHIPDASKMAGHITQSGE